MKIDNLEEGLIDEYRVAIERIARKRRENVNILNSYVTFLKSERN